MNALKDSDFRKLSPLARMHRAIEELDSKSIAIAAATTLDTENPIESKSDLARWRVNQKLITARTSANIERMKREAARKRARVQAETSTEESAHEEDDSSTEAG